MAEKRTRIPLNQPQPGLNAAFSALEGVGLPPGPEVLAAAPVSALKRGRVVLRREKAGRGGKTVVVASDFATHLTLPFLEELARRMRAACGCGGALKGRTIEMQGDQISRIREFLERDGFLVGGVK